MVEEAEIFALFKELGLEREQDRNKMLAQGRVDLTKEDHKKPLKVESDNITIAEPECGA